MSLVFYPKSHRYKLDGKWVPGVTTLIGKGLPKPFLIDWAARMAAEYAAVHREALITLDPEGMIAAVKSAHTTKRDRAGKRGTSIHRLAERVIHGEEVDVPEALVGFVEAAVQFMDDWSVEPLAVERPCASRTHWYAGTWDVVDRKGRIFDYKSSDAGIFGETALQENGYAFSDFYLDDTGTEQPTAELDISAAYGVHLWDGGYDVYPLEFGPHVFQDFLAVAASAAVAGRVRSYVLDPVEPPTDLKEVA